MAKNVKNEVAPTTYVIKGNRMIIDTPINEDPQPSSSGKTLILATSRGNQKVGVQFDGKEVTVGFNVYVKA